MQRLLDGKRQFFTVDMGGGKSQVLILNDCSPTLTTTHDGAPAVCYEVEDGTSYRNIFKEEIQAI